MQNKRLRVLWLTGRCNLKCRYCYASGGPQKDMDFETAQKAIDCMGDIPFKVQFAGGEPLLNLPLLEQVLCYLEKEKPGTQCSIQTNGTLLHNEAIELLKGYRVGIGVSLDGKPMINEKLRGRTKDALEGIQRLGQKGVIVNLNTVVCKENAGKLWEVADMAAYFGNIHGIGLDLLRNAGRTQDGNVKRASSEELAEGLIRLKERIDTWNRVLPRPLIVREFKKAEFALKSEKLCKDYCYAAQGNSFVVLPDGECYPCGSLAGRKQYYMGNVHSTVMPVKIPGEVPKECTVCIYGKVCTGGCPSRGLLNGGFDQLDCVLKKISFQLVQKTL